MTTINPSDASTSCSPIVRTPTTGVRPRATSFLARCAVRFCIFGIHCYQGLIRPWLIGTCKFCPTCSEYAAEALQKHGFWRGGRLAVRRVLRCHPFGPGGIDPVPKAPAVSAQTPPKSE